MKNRFRNYISTILALLVIVQCHPIHAAAEIVVDQSDSVLLISAAMEESDRTGSAMQENTETGAKETETLKAEAEDGLPYVEVFSSRSSVMTLGEPVVLTSVLHNAEGYEYLLQWQVDMGSGYEDIEGANDDSYTFEANAENLSYDWRVMLYYRPISG